MSRLEEAAEKGSSAALQGDMTGVSVRGYEDRSGPTLYTVYKCFYKGTKCAAKRYSEFEKLHKAVSAHVVALTTQWCARACTHAHTHTHTHTNTSDIV